MRPELRRKLRTSLLLIALILSSALVGAATVQATISSTPTAYVSPYSCEKGVDWVVFTDNAATPNYYATAGGGSATIPCGQLVFGGPNNLGAVTGTSFLAVLTAVVATNIVIMFESGTYVLASQFLDTTHNNVTLTSSSPSAIIAAKTGFGSSDMIRLVGVKYWTITGLTFDGSGMTQGAGAYAQIHMSAGSSYIKIQGDHFINGNQAEVDCVGNATTYSTHISYLDNILQVGTGYNGLEVDLYTRQAIVSGNQIVGGTNGIQLDSSSDTTVLGNSITSPSATGISLYDFSNTAFNDTVSNNIIYKPGTYGIDLSSPVAGGSSTAQKAISVAGNVIVGAGASGLGIAENSGYTAVDVTFQGNSIYQSLGTGIYISNAIGLSVTGNLIQSAGNLGILITPVSGTDSDFTIGENVIKNPVGNGMSIVGVTNWIVTGNRITSPGGHGISIASTAPNGEVIGNTIYITGTTEHGITNTANNVIVIGNTITLNASGSDQAIAIQSGVTGMTISNNVLIGFSNAVMVAISIKGTDTDIIISDNYFTNWLQGIAGSSGTDYLTITGNNFRNSVGTGIITTNLGAHSFIENNIPFNPVAPSTYTACASVCTYTNVDGYDETFTLLAINGISAWTCNGHAEPITLTDVTCTVPPSGTMSITWTVTAPTFTKVPLVA